MTVVKVTEDREDDRWPVLLAATVATGTYKQNVSVVNLSVVGCRIQCDNGLPPTGYVLISLHGFAALDGKIIWSEDNSAGIVFHPPLHPAVLNQIVEQNPPQAEELTISGGGADDGSDVSAFV